MFLGGAALSAAGGAADGAADLLRLPIVGAPRGRFSDGVSPETFDNFSPYLMIFRVPFRPLPGIVRGRPSEARPGPPQSTFVAPFCLASPLRNLLVVILRLRKVS